MVPERMIAEQQSLPLTASRGGRETAGPRGRLLALAAALMLTVSAHAAPDVGWGVPEDLGINISNIDRHNNVRAAYGKDGTAWVFFSEDALEGAFAKSEIMRFRYRRPGDSDWGTLSYSTIATRLICGLGGGPVFAALEDGRALLAYSVYGTAAGANSCTITGIRVLLLDPAEPVPVESYFRAEGPATCPLSRNPQIGVIGNRALVTWHCIPENGEANFRVESAYFDGTTWSDPLDVPDASIVYQVAGNTVAGTFHALARKTQPGTPLTQFVTSPVFDTVARGWAPQAEILAEPASEFVRGPIIALAIAAGDDGTVLAALRSPVPVQYDQVRHRDASGVWGELHILAYAGSLASSSNSLRLAAAPGGRYAAVWNFNTPVQRPDSNGIAAAVRRSDGSWTQPVDILGIPFDDFRTGSGGVTGFPNGSMAAWWIRPGDDATGPLYTVTLPAGSSCWRVPLDMGQVVSFGLNSNLDAGPGGDFLAAWLRFPQGLEITERYPQGLIAQGPDGSGGSDACLDPPAGTDTAPDPFLIPVVYDAPQSTLVTSDPITVQGINGPAEIIILNNSSPNFTYSVNCSAFTTEPGTVNDGDRVRVRVLSAAGPSSGNGTTIVIGGIYSSFQTFTVAEGGQPVDRDDSIECPSTPGDTTPDPFSFSPVNGAALGSVVQSAVIIVQGIDAAAPVSISGGEYSINGAAYTAAAGSVSAGDSIRVRVTASGSNSATTSATLTIGGVSGTFQVTTLAATTEEPPEDEPGSGGSSSLDLFSLLWLMLAAGGSLRTARMRSRLA